jgi:hypothetical protein
VISGGKHLSKVDATKMSDEDLNRRFDRLGNGMNWGFYVFLGGAAVCIASIVFTSVPLLTGIAIAAGGMTSSMAFGKVRDPYEVEKTRRRWMNTSSPSLFPPEPEAEFSAPAVTSIFNPAAATVLENDMRPMAPLRLRKRVSELLRI